MPIPKTRQELVELIESEFSKLDAELNHVDDKLAQRVCVDSWTIKDLLAVRLWWSRSVLNWIDKGRQDKVPITPAKGYRWKETPCLNNDIVEKARGRSYQAIRKDLKKQFKRLLSTIESLTDHDLLNVGVYQWAGNYPVSRWLSINTARQYHTARAFIRKAKRNGADVHEPLV